MITDNIDSLAAHLSGSHDRFVYGYVRVSSSKQEREGLSIPAQEGAIRAYCDAQGLSKPFIVTEVSSAGRRMFSLPSLVNREPEPTDSRPRLLLLLGHLARLGTGHLIAWRLDRIARLNDEREIIYQLLLRSSVKLHSTDPGEQLWIDQGDPSDPMAALTRSIFGAFSQYEKAMIEARMRLGMNLKASRGGYTGGRPPYGYVAVDGELKINEAEAPMVRYIYMLRHKYAQPIRGISSIIESSTGKKFSRSRVHKVLMNEGIYRGRYRDRFGAVHTRPDLKILDEGDTHNYDKEFEHDRPQQ